MTPSAIGEDVRTDGFYDHVWHPAYPGFVISREHYGRIVRMLDRKQPVKMALTLAVRMTDASTASTSSPRFRAPIPRCRSEVVMLGGHLDSWHSGTGATDNGAGVRGRAGGDADPEGDRRPAAADDPRRAVDRRRAGLFRIGRLRRDAFRRR